jgi:hypothetical protein
MVLCGSANVLAWMFILSLGVVLLGTVSLGTASPGTVSLGTVSLGIGGPEVIDRIMAVVGRQPITLSDVRAARVLGLVTPIGKADSTDGQDGGVLQRLIDRELMRAEAERFAAVIDDRSTVTARIKSLEARFGSGEALSSALDRLGMSPARLTAWIEDDVRIERYVQERFDTAAQPSEEEARLYFQSREHEFMIDGRPRSFAEASDEVRSRLVAERRARLIDEWLAVLRRRTPITIVPQTPEAR